MLWKIYLCRLSPSKSQSRDNNKCCLNKKSRKIALTIWTCLKIFLSQRITCSHRNLLLVSNIISFRTINFFLNKKKIFWIIKKIRIFSKFQKCRRFLNFKKLSHQKMKINSFFKINWMKNRKLLNSDHSRTKNKFILDHQINIIKTWMNLDNWKIN